MGYDSNIHPELFGLYKGNYHKALAHFGEPKYGDTYFEMLQHFKLNTAKLAAYKSLLVTKRLKGLEGSEHFDVEAMATLKKFNQFQVAEYNTLVARSRSAKQFNQFAKEAKLFPNIEWVRTRSATPREKHLAFAGLVLPQNHPFWQSNQPGNLWNCKCDWRSTDAPASDFVPKDVTPPPGLEGNPAITGELITNSHPYINKANKSAIDDLEAIFYESENIPVSVLAHKDELTDNINTAQILGTNFSNLDIKIRPHIFKTGAKNPEFEIGGLLADAKRIKGYKGITTGISKAINKQDCKIVIIDFNKHFSIKKPLNIDAIVGRILWRTKDFNNDNIVQLYFVFGKKALMIDKTLIDKKKLYTLIKGLMPDK